MRIVGTDGTGEPPDDTVIESFFAWLDGLSEDEMRAPATVILSSIDSIFHRLRSRELPVIFIPIGTIDIAMGESVIPKVIDAVERPIPDSLADHQYAGRDMARWITINEKRYLMTEVSEGYRVRELLHLMVYKATLLKYFAYYCETEGMFSTDAGNISRLPIPTRLEIGRNAFADPIFAAAHFTDVIRVLRNPLAHAGKIQPYGEDIQNVRRIVSDYMDHAAVRQHADATPLPDQPFLRVIQLANDEKVVSIGSTSYCDTFIELVNGGEWQRIPADSGERAKWFESEIPRFVHAVDIHLALRLALMPERFDDERVLLTMRIPHWDDIWRAPIAFEDMKRLAFASLDDPRSVAEELLTHFPRLVMLRDSLETSGSAK